MSSNRTIFLSGVDMQPSAIRDRWPAARFRARTKIAADRAEISPYFADALPEANGRAIVWGIAIDCSEPIEGKHRDGETDAGERIELILVELPLLAGEPEAVLAAAL